MEGTHMRDQQPSNDARKPTSRILAFSSKPKTTTTTTTTAFKQLENSQMSKLLTWSSMCEHHHQLQQAQSLAAARDNKRDFSHDEGNDGKKPLLLLHKETTCGRDRLKRHREEVSGHVMIPETWGQENLLMDWVDYASFDRLLAPSGITSARDALIAEGRRATSQRLRVESSC